MSYRPTLRFRGPYPVPPLNSDGTPPCEDFPNPESERCFCSWNKNLECYEGWYDEYYHKTHDDEGNVI